jgi:glycosyltransferase involved in cell wall biosynthesis
MSEVGLRRTSPAASLPAKRILMIAPTPFFADRGGHVRIYEEARALQAMGCQVEICTYPLGNDRPGLRTHRTVQIPWYKKLEAGPSWHKLYIDLLLLFKTWAVARRFRPDVIHGHLHEGVAIGWVVGRLQGVPHVAGAERWLDHLPRVVVASCDDVARELGERFSLEDVILAMDGVDTESFRPDVEVGDLRSLVPPERRVVVYLGLLTAYQGIDHLLEAIPGVLARVPRAYFLVMGYPNVEHYRQKVRNLGLTDYVKLTGRIDYDQAARYLALGEVAVGPKLSETESNGKLYNYMACALPTVAFDTPVSREILGNLGVYAPRGDVPALANAIAGLLQNPDQSRQLGLALRQRVEEHFSWESTAQQLMKAYALAMSKK